jgi:hypothetical protein
MKLGLFEILAGKGKGPGKGNWGHSGGKGGPGNPGGSSKKGSSSLAKDLDKTKIASIAQKVYDEWDQSDEEFGDPELGFGGICQDIADEVADYLSGKGIDATTVSSQIGEQHVWVVAKFKDGTYEIDIPPSVYETGGGYNWKKIPDVKITGDDVVVYRLGDASSFDEYTEE